MATLNLTKIGGLVKVEYTGRADAYFSKNSPVSFIEPGDGSQNVEVSVAGTGYSLPAITDIQVSGVACANQTDFETKIATVFPDAGGTATPTLQDVINAGNTLSQDNEFVITEGNSVDVQFGDFSAQAGEFYGDRESVLLYNQSVPQTLATIQSDTIDPDHPKAILQAQEGFGSSTELGVRAGGAYIRTNRGPEIPLIDYTKYECHLFAYNSNPPYPNILGNNTIGVINFYRVSQGVYRANQNGAFPQYRTAIICSGLRIMANRISDDEIEVTKLDGEDGMGGEYIKIMVFYSNELQD